MMLLLINSPARMKVVIELGDVTSVCVVCTLCVVLSVSCVYVIRSFTYVLRVVI